jgi:hypothetical protein
MIIRVKRGVITYKTTNKISTFQKRFEINHQQAWKDWIEQKKNGVKEIHDLQTKGVAPTYLLFLLSLIMQIFIARMIL